MLIHPLSPPPVGFSLPLSMSLFSILTCGAHISVQLDEWTHEFKTRVTIDEDSACAIAKSIENSMALNKAELDAPMLLLPIDLAPFIAGDKKMHINGEKPQVEVSMCCI